MHILTINFDSKLVRPFFLFALWGLFEPCTFLKLLPSVSLRIMRSGSVKSLGMTGMTTLIRIEVSRHVSFLVAVVMGCCGGCLNCLDIAKQYLEHGSTAQLEGARQRAS